MQTNELKDYRLSERNEGILSFRLCSISADSELKSYPFVHMKRLVEQRKYDPYELKKYNSYVRINPAEKNGKVLFYPYYEPLKEVTAKFIGYKSIFNDTVALVLAESNNKKFFYFDPKSKETDYEKLLGLEKIIKLAMVTCDGTLWDMENDPDEDALSPNEFKQYKEKGFCKSTYLDYLDGLYTTIFHILDQDEPNLDTTLLIVKNPLNPNEKLELITHLEEDIKPKRISGDFYFLGYPIKEIQNDKQ